MSIDPVNAPINPFQAPSVESGTWQPQGALPFDEDDARQGTPWEQGAGPWLQRYLVTAWALYRSPGKFFDQVKLHGSVLSPILFNVVGLAFATSLLLSFLALSMLATISTKRAAVVMATALFGNLACNLLLALALHLPLRAVWGMPRSIRTTLRTIYYAGGAAALLYAIPAVGGTLSGLVLLWLTSIGLARTQNIRFWKTALVLLAWCVLLLGATIVLLLLLVILAEASVIDDAFFDAFIDPS